MRQSFAALGVKPQRSEKLCRAATILENCTRIHNPALHDSFVVSGVTITWEKVWFLCSFLSLVKRDENRASYYSKIVNIGLGLPILLVSPPLLKSGEFPANF